MLKAKQEPNPYELLKSTEIINLIEDTGSATRPVCFGQAPGRRREDSHNSSHLRVVLEQLDFGGTYTAKRLSARPRSFPCHRSSAYVHLIKGRWGAQGSAGTLGGQRLFTAPAEMDRKLREQCLLLTGCPGNGFKYASVKIAIAEGICRLCACEWPPSSHSAACRQNRRCMQR